MFDLAAAVHDHFKATIVGDLGSFFADLPSWSHSTLALVLLLGGQSPAHRQTGKDIDDIDRMVDSSTRA